MDGLFTIGETAKMLDTTIATLRHYDAIGLLKPAYVDPKTKYRYYAETQLHYIDRIKYLQSLGLRLEQIKEVLSGGDVPSLLPFLKQQRKEYRKMQMRIREKISDLNWYIHYYTYLDMLTSSSGIYMVHEEERYLAAVPFTPGELGGNKVDTGLRLSQLRSSENFKNLHYLRMWSYVMDFDTLAHFDFSPRYSAMHIKSKPSFSSDNILVLPAGDYLCFKAEIYAGRFGELQTALDFIREQGLTPKLAVANEYENNFNEYRNTPYEVQILLSADDG